MASDIVSIRIQFNIPFQYRISLSIMIYSIIFTLIAFQRYWEFFQSHITTDIDIVNSSSSIGDNLTISHHKNDLQYCQQMDVAFIKTYLAGINIIVALNIPLLLVMISSSSRGAICDVQARRHVTPLLYLKYEYFWPFVNATQVTKWNFTLQTVLNFAWNWIKCDGNFVGIYWKFTLYEFRRCFLKYCCGRWESETKDKQLCSGRVLFLFWILSHKTCEAINNDDY